ncbi:hypothetical protein AAFN86_18580 [Roseomonas sp. CAU 1739]|uniref:hypothetical protein n=1 Tax=Roseomonas sp. CAU 1739 TaxID=3140364 RepID=UPI00325C299F
MPLTIVDAEAEPEAAGAIFRAGWDLTFRQNGEAGMGGFWVSQRAGLDTVLTTSGAITCVIIVIRTIDGNGALGHYAAEVDPNEVLRGVAVMIQCLDQRPIDAVLFAAGMIGVNPEQSQYQDAIIAGTRQLAPCAPVDWRLELRNGSVPDAAVFLPHTGQVALFDSLPRQFIGRSDAGNGLTPYSYGGLLR